MIEIQGISPDMIANNLGPFKPTHPGEVIKDEIEYRHITQKELAEKMEVSYNILNEVVNGKRAMSSKFALLCEAVLGIPAHILTGLQADYDLQVAKRDQSFLKKLKGIKKIAAVL
ncbi:MAG: HigA family addiction module antitoxin [Alloprevotella sp.]